MRDGKVKVNYVSVVKNEHDLCECQNGKKNKNFIDLLHRSGVESEFERVLRQCIHTNSLFFVFVEESFGVCTR